MNSEKHKVLYPEKRRMLVFTSLALLAFLGAQAGSGMFLGGIAKNLNLDRAWFLAASPIFTLLYVLSVTGPSSLFYLVSVGYFYLLSCALVYSYDRLARRFHRLLPPLMMLAPLVAYIGVLVFKGEVVKVFDNMASALVASVYAYLTIFVTIKLRDFIKSKTEKLKN